MSGTAAVTKSRQPLIINLLGVSVLVALDQLIKDLVPGAGRPPHVLPLTSLLALAFGFYLLYKGSNSPSTNWGIAAILGGGLSNMLDYLVHGSIRDNFIVAYAEFNLADIYIFIGISMILWEIGSKKPNKMSKVNTTLVSKKDQYGR